MLIKYLPSKCFIRVLDTCCSHFLTIIAGVDLYQACVNFAIFFLPLWVYYEKSSMVTYYFFSSYVKEILLYILYIKIIEILRKEFCF